MKSNKLIKALRRIMDTGSLSCYGCGYEHDCSTKGCAIMRDAIAEVEARQIERRALEIAAVIMQTDGLCRYESAAECRRVWPPTEKECVRCIMRWCCARAKKELAEMEDGI